MCWGLPSGTRLHALLVQLEERRLQNRVSNASVRGISICTPSHRGPSLSGGLRLEPNRLESKHDGSMRDAEDETFESTDAGARSEV